LKSIKKSKISDESLVLLNTFMQSYQTIKDMKLRDAWLKKHGYNPATFFNPDFGGDYIRAKAAAHQLLTKHRQLITQEQINQLEGLKSNSTARQIYQTLNLYKKIRRQLHRHSKR
jgi:hypothetical protein